MTRRKGEIDRSFFDDMLGEVEAASRPDGVSELPFESIRPRTEQFRRSFDEEAIGALASSIDEVGLLEPIVVRVVGGIFEIVAGERRFRALGRLGWDRVPVRVVSLNDAKAELAGAVENLNREDLNPLEEVDAVLSVLSHALDLPRDEVITRITRVRSAELGDAQLPTEEVTRVTEMFRRLGYTSVNSFYANRLSLMRFPKDLLEAMRSHGLAYTKARVLARVKNLEVRQDLTARTLRDNLSVEELERTIRPTKEKEVKEGADTLYSSFGRVKRHLTKGRISRLDTTGQRRLRKLLREMEKLLEEKI